MSATRNTCVPELTSTSYWACHISLSSATGKSRHTETPAAALFHVRANFSPYNEDNRSGIREKPRVISHSFDAGYKIVTNCVLISTFKTHSQEIIKSSFCEVIGETRNIKNIVSSFVLLGQWSHWRYFWSQHVIRVFLSEWVLSSPCSSHSCWGEVRTVCWLAIFIETSPHCPLVIQIAPICFNRI